MLEQPGTLYTVIGVTAPVWHAPLATEALDVNSFMGFLKESELVFLLNRESHVNISNTYVLTRLGVGYMLFAHLKHADTM